MVKPSPAGCASSSSPVHHDATAVFSRGESWSYRGVRKRKWGKYVSEIRVPNSRDRIWLGSYDTAEKAARAFDAALFCLRGRSAKFNFPDNPPAPEVIRGGSSLQLTPAEIQSAAATFAHLHHPPPPPKITTTIPPPSRDCNNNNNMVQGDRYNSCSPASSAQGTLVLHNINGRTSTADNNRALLDLYRTVGSGNYGSDLGFVPEIDSLVLNDHLLTLPTPAAVDYGDHHEYNNMDPSIWTIPQDPFLWNF